MVQTLTSDQMPTMSAADALLYIAGVASALPGPSQLKRKDTYENLHMISAANLSASFDSEEINDNENNII